MKLKSAPLVLGISASHNGSACLLRGQKVVVAIQEERLNRIKRSRIYGARYSLAVDYCLKTAGIRVEDLDMIVLCSQRSFSDPDEILANNPQLQPALHRIDTKTISHHLGHAISTFVTSGFSAEHRQHLVSRSGTITEPHEGGRIGIG